MCRKLLNISQRALNLQNTSFRIVRNYSSDYKIVPTKDETTLVAWHPKNDFPYEYTKPLPLEKVIENPSVLKTQLTPELMSIFNKKTSEQARLELMNITYTTKHRWFPRSRDRKAKKTPMDREYL